MSYNVCSNCPEKGKGCSVDLDDCEPVIGSAYDDGADSDFDKDDSD